MDLSALADRLTGILPADGLITDPVQLRTYECDGLAQYLSLIHI